MRKLISFVAMSLDGYIAKPDGDISFLSKVEKEGQDYGYSAFLGTIDTIIVGRKTYDKILSIGFDYPSDKEIIIVTRNIKPDKDNLKYYSGSPATLVDELKSKKGKNIFCDGGSEVLNELISENQIDEFYISIIPVILGDGIPLFRKGLPPADLKLVKSEEFDTGLIKLHYERHHI